MDYVFKSNLLDIHNKIETIYFYLVINKCHYSVIYSQSCIHLKKFY